MRERCSSLAVLMAEDDTDNWLLVKTKPVTLESLVTMMKTLGPYWFEIVELPPSKNGGSDG